MLRSRQNEGRALISVLLVLCWIAVSLRVYVRTRLSKCFGLDDWLLLLALACFSTYCASALAAVYHGAGLDPKLVPPADFPYAVMFWWLATLFYNLSTLIVKLSISVFIHKLCPARIHKIIIWSVMGVVICFSTAYFFLSVFQCTPPNFFWQRFTGGKGKCLGDKVFPIATYAHSAISAMADWTLGILPIWLIWDLQMNRRTKISVGVLLGLGIIAGAAAIIRIPYIQILGDKKMFLYNVVDVSLWSLIEAAFGIIAAACSALRPLFKKFYELTTSGTRSRTKSNTYGSKFRSKSNTRKSFGMGVLSGHAGYNTELRSNPSMVGNGTKNGDVGTRSEIRGGKGATSTTFYKSDDESSLELGQESPRRAKNGSTSQENLTTRELESGSVGDIHVHTLVQVVSGRNHV